MPGNLGLTLFPGIKITIVLNHPNPNPYSKDHCDVQVIDDVVVAETVNSNGPANVPLKSCKVVLEDIIPKCGAEKLKTLNPPPEKTHKSDSRPKENRHTRKIHILYTSWNHIVSSDKNRVSHHTYDILIGEKNNLTFKVLCIN